MIFVMFDPHVNPATNVPIDCTCKLSRKTNRWTLLIIYWIKLYEAESY